RKGGKWAVAYLETAGEFSPGNRDYYLATACDTIWLAPPGDINLVGVYYEVPFLRGTLDLLGIAPDMDHIGKYKSAMNTITDKAGRYYTGGPKIALIYGVGGVSRGENDLDPLSGDTTMGSDTMSAAIRQAREDSSIKAIVFRVDSPGGSYIASDLIYREVMLARQA